MRRFEQTPLSPGAIRELAAIDHALAGEAGNPADAPVAELTHALRDMRARPAADFTSALDARAARGFRREPRRAGRVRAPAWLRAHPRAWSALGAAGSVAALVAVAVVLTAPGSHGPIAAPSTDSAQEHLGVAEKLSAPSGAGAAKGTASAAVAGPAAPPTPAGPPAREVERTSTLEVGVAPASLQSAAQRVFTLVDAYGGYVRQSNVSSGGSEGGASFDARVPTSNLAGAIAALSRLGHVRAETDTTNDVSERYEASRRSIGDAQAERVSLLKQLAAGSATVREAELKARLHAVETRIAALSGELRALRTRIDYTPLALSLTPEHKSVGAGASDLTPGGAAHDAALLLDAALAVLVIAAAAALPVALVTIAGWMVVALTRRRLREQALDANT
jgi:hypothetical protein